jgi:hypothetical protein
MKEMKNSRYWAVMRTFTFIWPCIVINYFSTKPTEAFVSKFILVQNSICLGYFLYPSSEVNYCTFGTGTCYEESVQIMHASCRQTSITCASAQCTVANSWWWVEELPEICSFVQEWIWKRVRLLVSLKSKCYENLCRVRYCLNETKHSIKVEGNNRMLIVVL